MNRYEFRRLAGIRLEEAKVLRRNGKFEGCYYLCGYAVECALKACISKLTKRFDFPDKRLLQGVYSHDLNLLVKMARLEAVKDAEIAHDPRFKAYWYIVDEWSEQSRYELPEKQRAENLFKAVTDRRHGVLRWLRRHW